jgi:hypothetical protein
VTKHEFIFSNKKSHQVARHIAFWVVFILIFSIQSFGDPLAGFISKESLMHVLETDLCYLPVCVFSVYIFSNVLFPVFLKKKKYGSFITAFLLLVAFDLFINYYAVRLYFKLASVNTLTVGQKIMVDYSFVWSAILAGGFVLGIKLAKNWYQQQNENLLLAKQKASTELKVLKARIHPDLLFKTLDDIYHKINSGSPKSPLMILKLSEMLSYLLYESEQELVPLQDELTAVNDFISISKLSRADNLLSIRIVGNPDNKWIPPLLLLSLIQNSFAIVFLHSPQEEVPGVSILTTISIEHNLLTLILTNKNVKKIEKYRYPDEFFASEQRRLNLLFPENNCVLRLSRQEKLMEICLIISLNTSEKNVNPLNKEVYEPA